METLRTASNRALAHAESPPAGRGGRVAGLCLAFAVLSATGCSSLPPSTYQPSPEPRSRAGLTLKDAQEKTLKLMPGMTQDEVQALLGPPDETEASTFGSKTARPWSGIVWRYRWTGFSSKRLDVVFAQWAPPSWVLNHWTWFDF